MMIATIMADMAVIVMEEMEEKLKDNFLLKD
jgi:hypothetical protein